MIKFPLNFTLLASILFLFAMSPLHAAKLNEVGWPKEITNETHTVKIYQPQIESLTKNKLEARAAVSLQKQSDDMPRFGAIWISCDIETDLQERLINIKKIHITDAKASSGDTSKINAFKTALEKELNGSSMTIELDRVLADLDDTKTKVEFENNLNDAAPEIIYSQQPAVLVYIDGKPILKDAEGTKLQYVLNTPFIMIYDPAKSTYYLKGGRFWYSSASVTDEWASIKKPPKKVLQLADQATNEEEETGTDNTETPPEIYVRLTPAELIVLDGDPDYAPINNTELLYIKNTDSDILMDIKGQRFYLLLSGRWYTSESLPKGSWEYVKQEDLPEDFAAIPTESDMSGIRASVSGTDEAREAALENQIPQTAEIDIKTATLEVDYDGEPQFIDIEGTKMSFAVNTDKSVLFIKNKYYCCDNAVWFKANRATGPWEVATSIPDDIQNIPPECPVYNVKYVYIYDSTPEVVYVGYTPGYTWSYVQYGCVVYGTGYYYHPWYGRYYYPRPVTYGFGVHYNPYTGWGFSYGMSYGWFHMGWGTPYHPGWWGPGGYHYGYRHGYHPGPRPMPNRPPSNNIYRQRDNGVRHTGIDRRPPGEQSRPGSRQPQTGRNDVLTDRSGNVYRRDQNGSWEQNHDGKWQSPMTPSNDRSRPEGNTRESRPSQPSTRPNQPTTRESLPSTQPSTRPSTPNNLNRDFQSRERGAQRSQQFRSNPGTQRQQGGASRPMQRSGGAGGASRGTRR